MDVIETPAGWGVEDNGKLIAGPFSTNAEAWKWIDERDGRAAIMEDTRRRIGNAFSDR